MLVRRERPEDIADIAAVTSAAFRTVEGVVPVEVGLVQQLRASPAWLAPLSLVAEASHGEVIGHVVCTRGDLDGRAALGLGPLSVLPDRQRQGVGTALMHAVLGAADALDEPLVVVLGEPTYYCRFGFRPADELGVTPPEASWKPYFQGRPLSAYTPELRGVFRYAEPFNRV